MNDICNEGRRMNDNMKVRIVIGWGIAILLTIVAGNKVSVAIGAGNMVGNVIGSYQDEYEISRKK